MMNLIERLAYFLLGSGIGFVLGYIVAYLRTIESKVDRVEKEVLEVDRTVNPQRDERGEFKAPPMGHVWLFIIIVMVSFSAFQTSKVNGELNYTISCLTNFNERQNNALNHRDLAIKNEVAAEIKLWGLYNRLYKEGTQPNVPVERLKELQDTLAKAIQEYRSQLVETQKSRSHFAYGDPNVLKDCED